MTKNFQIFVVTTIMSFLTAIGAATVLCWIAAVEFKIEYAVGLYVLGFIVSIFVAVSSAEPDQDTE